MRMTLGRRFSVALISVVTVILAGFAATAISINVTRLNAQLAQQVEQTAAIAQRSLVTPLWNLEEDTIHDILEAVLATDGMVYVRVETSEGEVSTRSLPQFADKDVSFFADTS